MKRKAEEQSKKESQEIQQKIKRKEIQKPSAGPTHNHYQFQIIYSCSPIYDLFQTK